MPKKRVKVPPKIETKLMVRNRHTCCMCRQQGKHVDIHHIDEDPSNNEMENLAVVCKNDQSLVHGNEGLGRKYKMEEVKFYKKEWESICMDPKKYANFQEAEQAKNREVPMSKFDILLEWGKQMHLVFQECANAIQTIPYSTKEEQSKYWNRILPKTWRLLDLYESYSILGNETLDDLFPKLPKILIEGLQAANRAGTVFRKMDEKESETEYYRLFSRGTDEQQKAYDLIYNKAKSLKNSIISEIRKIVFLNETEDLEG